METFQKLLKNLPLHGLTPMVHVGKCKSFPCDMSSNSKSNSHGDFGAIPSQYNFIQKNLRRKLFAINKKGFFSNFREQIRRSLKSTRLAPGDVFKLKLSFDFSFVLPPKNIISWRKIKKKINEIFSMFF